MKEEGICGRIENAKRLSGALREVGRCTWHDQRGGDFAFGVRLYLEFTIRRERDFWPSKLRFKGGGQGRSFSINCFTLRNLASETAGIEREG